MRPAFIILPLVALTACATPREECIRDVTRDARIISSLIREVEGNIARGYALEESQEVRTRTRFCSDRHSDGSTFRYPCNEVDTFTVTQPVAIDLRAEEAKLASLRERLAVVQPAADQGVAQCIATHPE